MKKNISPVEYKMYSSISFFVAGKEFDNLVIFKLKALNLMKEFLLFQDLKENVN